MDNVFFFVELQCRLVPAFSRLYPNAKDIKWLLDFPKSGYVFVDSDQWRFVRHGTGLRFERITCEPHWVVDIHQCVSEPKVIDEWRLLQFFESCGKCMDKLQVQSLLNDMSSQGYLLGKGGGQYLLIKWLDGGDAGF